MLARACSLIISSKPTLPTNLGSFSQNTLAIHAFEFEFKFLSNVFLDKDHNNSLFFISNKPKDAKTSEKF